jgi:hypothetical protein
VLELVRQYFCSHVTVLPESAGILFGGGFPRGGGVDQRKAAQRAIFHVQRELEASVGSTNSAVVLCDRGTVDGAAYWPGPEDFWSALGTSRKAEVGRYGAVVHLRTPAPDSGYTNSNPLRVETAAEAAVIDELIAKAWNGHPRMFRVEPTTDFLGKALRALLILHNEVPECCRHFTTLPVDAETAPAA